MNRRVTVSSRLSNLLGIVNLWAVGGGGILIALAGRPLFGGLLIAAAVILFGLTLAGRLGGQREMTLSNLVLIAAAIPLLLIGLLLLGVIIPPNLDVVWYGYLAVLILLSGSAIFLAARDVRSGA